MKKNSDTLKEKQIPWLPKEHLGTLLAVCSGLLYGLLGYFGISIIQEDITVYNMLFWRFLVSTILIGILLIPWIKKWQDKPKDLFMTFFFGFIFYGIGSLIYFLSSLYIGTGLAMVIFFCHPAIVLFINYVFFKTKVTKIYYGSVALIMIGLTLLIDFHELKLDILGIGLAILSSIFYAIYIVASKRYKVSPLNSTFMVSLGSMISAGVLALIDSNLIIPHTTTAWLNIFGIGIICTAIPILLLLQALKYIPSEKVAILSVLEPICVVMAGIWLLDEKMNPLQMFGSIIVLSAALLTIIYTHKNVKVFTPVKEN